MPTRSLLTLRELAAGDTIPESTRGAAGFSGSASMLPFRVRTDSTQLPTTGPYAWVALDDGRFLVVAGGRRWVAE